MEYTEKVKKFALATGMGGMHTMEYVNCQACHKTKATLELEGEKEICAPFEHMGECVLGELLNIKERIKLQTTRPRQESNCLP